MLLFRSLFFANLLHHAPATLTAQVTGSLDPAFNTGTGVAGGLIYVRACPTGDSARRDKGLRGEIKEA